MKTKLEAILSAIAVLFAASESQAAQDASTASATVMAPASVSSTSELRFGKFSARTGGSIVIGADGARSATGAVEVSSLDGGSAAAFTVGGEANATFAVTLPSSATLTRAGDETETISVDAFASNPSGPALLGGGDHTLSVGATLTLGESQPAGTYSGTFDVSIEYN